MGSFLPAALFAVSSLRAPYLDRCFSCSTPPTWVSFLPVFACHTPSLPPTLSFTSFGLHRQLHSSGIDWSEVSSGSPNGCVPTDCVLTPRRRTPCGVRPVDSVCILTPLSWVSVGPFYGPRPLCAISASCWSLACP